MSMRKIHIGNEEWEYRVGKETVVLQTPLGSKMYIGCHTIKGLSPDDFERGKWKKTSDGMITPSEIKAYIENKYMKVKK